MDQEEKKERRLMNSQKERFKLFGGDEDDGEEEDEDEENGEDGDGDNGDDENDNGEDEEERKGNSKKVGIADKTVFNRMYHILQGQECKGCVQWTLL